MADLSGCGEGVRVGDVRQLSLAAFSFPSPADAEPPRVIRAVSDDPTRNEVDRTCYRLCFTFSGKARDECYMKVDGEWARPSHHGQKKGSGHVCKWFDEFNKDASTEVKVVERHKEAMGKRESALHVKKLRRRAKPKVK